MAFRKVSIDWKLKAIAFNALDKLPLGSLAYYLLQRYVTKTIPRSVHPTEKAGCLPILHTHKFREYGVDVSSAKLFEFGAGWDLYSNLIFYCYGINNQHTIDIRRWLKAEPVNAIIKALQTDPPEGCVRVPEHLIRQAHLEDDLLQFYGIIYDAPADACTVKLPDCTVDVISTTSVLEHVPEYILSTIISECYRILKKGGLMSHAVDYSDHYSHSDPTINEFNYLSYSERQWKWYNPAIHYQNRLRTKCYKRIFEINGFKVIETEPWRGTLEALNNVPINSMFSDYTIEELQELGCYFLAIK